MTTQYGYLIIDGEYVLYSEGEAICPPTAELSIAFDKNDGVLHKHGAPALVQAWHVAATKRLRDAGFIDLADDLICISGRFPLEDINRCLDCSGYIGRFYAKLLAEKAAPASQISTEA